MIMLPDVKFDEKGLIPAVIQDINSGQVLMVAYMNEESLAQTRATGYTWFFSRSRQKLWMKGETSGNTQKVEQILYDCDADTLLVQVTANGPACHTGNDSCFYRALDSSDTSPGPMNDSTILRELYAVIARRRQEMPEGSYTSYLFRQGIDKILKKVGEESAEVIIAAKNNNKDELIYETSDLIYHLMVLLVEQGLQLSDIYRELRSRR